jgi:hypothetical protein
MIIDGRKIKAEEGRVLRRLSDKAILGEEIDLGYTYYINGEKLAEPLLELPEHYEEVTQEQIDEEAALAKREEDRKRGEKVDALIRERYTLSEELSILRQRDVKVEEFKAYNEFCEECKQRID